MLSLTFLNFTIFVVYLLFFLPSFLQLYIALRNIETVLALV